MNNKYTSLSILLLIPIIPIFAAEDVNIHSVPLNDNEDYVRYDLKDKYFTMPTDFEKLPLPDNIRESMLDWCEDSSTSMKNNPRFWDTVPVQILTTVDEFQSVNGKTGSFIIHSYVTEESCPPHVEMLGTFTSKQGEHEFVLYYDGDSFGYQIDNTPQNESISSPLKQFNSGVLPNDIQCKDGLHLVLKMMNNHPACVKSETKQKLVERGWVKLI